MNRLSIRDIMDSFDMPEEKAKEVKFHCEDCSDNRSCDFAWDLYNTYDAGL